MDDVTTTPRGTDERDRRRAEALTLAGGRPDEQLQADVRRRGRRVIGALIVAWVVLTVAAGAVGVVLARRHPDHDRATGSDPALWQQIVGLSLTGAGLVVVVAGIVVLVRAGQWGARWRSPVARLTRADRRAARRQVLGRAPVDPDLLPVVRDLAGRMGLMRWLLVLYSGVLLSQLGSALLSPSVFRFGVFAVIAVLYVVAAVLLERDGRRARRFLAEHPAPADR